VHGSLLVVFAVAGAWFTIPASAVADVPVNVTPPTVLSSPPDLVVVGQQLADGGGAWTATPPPGTSISIQWLDCDQSGQACAPIAGATTSSYTVQATDRGSTIRVQETASNGPDTSAPVRSAPTVVVTQIPKNTTPPSITGNPRRGGTLTASPGVWTPSDVSLTYRWFGCPPFVECRSPIAGATGATYRVAGTDPGRIAGVLVEVTATDSTGRVSTTAYSDIISIPLPSTPTNTAVPTISGIPDVGATLTASPGSWTQDPAPDAGQIRFSYQWVSCDTRCERPITGATGQTYKVRRADLGGGVAVLVTATDGIGPSQAYSRGVVVRLAAPGGQSTTPRPLPAGLRRVLVLSGRSSSVAQLVKHNGYVTKLTASTPGRLLITWSIRRKGGKRIIIGRARATYSAATTRTVHFRLTRTGKARLRRARLPTLRLTAQFTQPGPPPRTTTARAKAIKHANGQLVSAAT
jgi:hypothetical protein